ncbi:MAG: MoxR family ATPase [Gemmatimonadales bacterium]|nr:MAG: MoxR family ATPase [Gemmatimonadales bacterium]
MEEAHALAHGILDETCRAVVGKRTQIRLILSGLLADGHVLLDDVPGVAKTLTARSLARAAGLDFSRVQFTPDVLPADITGALVLDLATRTPEFRPGPVFTDLLLADEVNRAPAKTQSALLEAMQERQVTVDGTPRPLERPFLVIATQNPVESEGTYPLPEAQLDRFLLRTTMGYPSAADEITLLRDRVTRKADEIMLEPRCDVATFVRLQRSLEEIHVDARLLEYAVAVVRATREDGRLAVGASPRGTLALVKLSRAQALLEGRDHVGPDDVRSVAVAALGHRVVLSDDAWARRADPDEVVREAVDSVAVPDASPDGG